MKGLTLHRRAPHLAAAALLLAAPASEGPVALVQPHIFYKFADPALEARSAGHKLMLRIGNDNAERIKAKLREIRTELTSGIVAPPAQ